MLGITRFTGKVQVRLLCLILCYSLLLSSLPGVWRGGSSSSQSATPQQGGVRTQGPPSPNLPNIDAIRARGVRKQDEVKLPEPARAKRCRHWDKRCQQLKEKKAWNRSAPANSLKGLLADNRQAYDRYFDWRANQPSLLPELDLLLRPSPRDFAGSLTAKDGDTDDANPKHLPRAFAASLVPMAAMQSTNFETARVEPRNRTGRAGEDLFSGNYHWSLPIVSLPGRAGHDLNLTLAYNSLVWTKAGSTLRFDMDYGWPSPGFRFGFPVFSGPYVNSTTNRQAYIVIAPSGEAVEMRKVTGYETYEAEDSSYLRLKFDTTLGGWILTAAGGTQFIYGATLDIKDRNGNRITATYNTDGLMDTITDTLGRQILLEYGEYYELLKVKQVWNGIEKTLAQFDYADQQLLFNFGSLFVDNVTYGQTIPAVSQVTLLDNSRYVFDYSTYGQINKIRRKGGLTFDRAWTAYNLPNNSAGQQSDCPLFTTRTDWAYDWSISAGVATQFAFNQSVANPDAATETTAPTLTYGQMTAPDGTIHKEYYYPSPASTYKWRYGLLKMTDTIAGGVLKKQSKLNWEQPCGGGTIGNWLYQCNPRVMETNIYDNTDGDANTWENRRRVTLAYAAGNPQDFNLISDVYEYDANATTVLRRTHTDYNQTSTYINRRLLNLPTASFLYDGSNVLNSKVEYVYDESGYLQATSATPTQHDSTNYGTGFLAGRGNQTTVRRYDVTTQSSVEWKTGYNITGSPIFSRDPLYGTTGAQTSISYTDKWVSATNPDIETANRNTFAYPTTITDPDNNSSTIKYDFDWGTVRLTIDPKGAATMSEYDGWGRRWKTTSGYGSTSPFYTALSFDSQQNWISSLSSIESGQPDFFSITTFDGHDRVRATVSDHPGSTGQNKAVYRAYDTMGRQTQISNPTEVNGVWSPVGDDVAGWAWSFQTYDWQGRPLVSTNQDGTTKSVSYTGCGCAGTQEMTITDEGTVVINPNNGQPETKKRQQKIAHDILGRVVKTQTLNWENGSAYSTTINSYNVRDQIANVKEYSGNATGAEACPSATCQKTTMSYDGHGRLSQRQLPVEDAPTVYTYAADDKPLTVEDARHAKTIYGYGAFSNPTSANNRRLLSSISHDLTNVTPSGSVPATPTVTFGYDQVGNRVWMDDEPGKVDYTYDTLSRLETEKRVFDGLSGNYQFTYTYNLAGQISTVTDNRFNTVLTYNHDKAGQLTTLTGTGFESSGQTNFTSAITPVKYRAWGGIKEVSYGNNLKSAYDYNTRLQPTSYRLLNAQSQVKDGSDYQYYPDARIKFASNLVASNPVFTVASAFDRAYKYDHAGRLSEALTGLEASGGSAPSPPSVNLSPYKQVNAYDEWGNLTSRTNRFWRSNPNDSATYVNNRRQGPSYSYDYAGNLLSDGWIGSTYDAAGRIVRSDTLTPPVGGGTTGLPSQPSAEIVQDLDGEGRPAKRVETRRTDGLNENMQPIINSDVTTTYYVRSSLAGGDIVSELNDQGGKVKGYIHALGGRLAEQVGSYTGGPYSVLWRHTNPVTGTLLKGNDRMEYASLGEVVGNYDPWVDDPTPTYQDLKGEQPLYIEGGDPFNPRSGCGTLDGMPISCSELNRQARAGNLQDGNGGDVLSLVGGVILRGVYGEKFVNGDPVGNVLVDIASHWLPVVQQGRFFGQRPKPSPRPTPLPTSQPAKAPSPVSKCPLWEEQGGNAGKLLQGIADVINSSYHSDTGTIKPNKQLSYSATVGMFEKNGWASFTNINPSHWGGADFEKHIDGAWFHLTIGYGAGQASDNTPIYDDSKSPVFITVHCEERWRPSSTEHAKDWWDKNVFRHLPSIPILPPVVFPRKS